MPFVLDRKNCIFGYTLPYCSLIVVHNAQKSVFKVFLLLLVS
jgi:hypothetical protein